MRDAVVNNLIREWCLIGWMDAGKNRSFETIKKKQIIIIVSVFGCSRCSRRFSEPIPTNVNSQLNAEQTQVPRNVCVADTINDAVLCRIIDASVRTESRRMFALATVAYASSPHSGAHQTAVHAHARWNIDSFGNYPVRWCRGTQLTRSAMRQSIRQLNQSPMSQFRMYRNVISRWLTMVEHANSYRI